MEELFKKIKIFKSNRHYRLGDLFYCKGWRFSTDIKTVLKENKYDDSLLKDYLSIKNKKIDNESWRKTILNHKKNIVTNDHTIYVNVRLGDVVMTPQGEIGDEQVYGKIQGLFIYNQHDLINQLSDIIKKHPDVRTILFVTTLNFGDNDIQDVWRFDPAAVEENKRLMCNLFQEITNRFELPIDIITSPDDHIQHIDNDFLTLCVAKHVVIDAGAGFGTLVKYTRKLLSCQ